VRREDRNVVILGVLAILGAILGFYFLLLSPRLTELDERAQERDAKQAQLAQLQQEVNQLEQVRLESPEIERQLLELSKRIPTQPEIPTVLVQVEEIANESGVTQLLIQPGEPTPPPAGGDFFIIPITMNFEGTYQELEDFLRRSRNLVRLVTVNSVTYEPAEAAEGEVVGPERLLQVQIEAEVYFQPSGVQGGPAPVAPVPPPEAGTEETTTVGGEETTGE
jgi:type IV pilus assembly protein PilO